MSEWMQGPPWEPIDVTDVLIAFPGDVRHLMPDPETLPSRHDLPGRWVQFQADWFMRGIDPSAEFYGQRGIDPEKAFRHLQCIQGSFQPKHEHKMAAVAFLASMWFTDETHWRAPEENAGG